jgi:signal transduction histidine kinase
VWVDVADDGPGIPVEFVEDVFRPGFRTDRRDGHFGAGLGLSLARRLARSSDGDVLIVAAARTGATVRVCLPPA